jgi:hypothetical protein
MDIQHIAAPVAGKEYPRNWNEFLDWFASEEACLACLKKLRWPGGAVSFVRPAEWLVNRTARAALASCAAVAPTRVR